MPFVVDSHAHIFPPSLEKYLSDKRRKALSDLRKRARSWMRPLASSMHKTQPMMRHLPESARKKIDSLSGIAPLANLLFESTANDLRDAMKKAGVDFALTIAHPTMIPNELVLEASQETPNLVPVVFIPRGTRNPGKSLRQLHTQGARALKIHPAADGDGPKTPRYHALLRKASELGLPVILHTGCIHSHVLYKDPEMGRAELFAPWFKEFPETRFILAHMNFHDPQMALDLALEHPNLYVDTSWQPAEMIGEAARRIGAERVLFGTDWPFVGDNLRVGLKRVRECVSMGMISEAQSEKILGTNAMKLFGIRTDLPRGEA